MSTVKIQRLGFSVLADGERDGVKPIANIVFVHGLRGHPRRTWEQEQAKQIKHSEGKRESKSNSSRLFSWRNRERSKSPVITERELGNLDNGGTYWPRDLLPKTIPNARVLTYGYDADVIGGLFQGASKNNITQHGRDLMLQLEREINGEPIIFVAHSLGGILVKEGLHWSKSNILPRYQEMHRCTKHIVFLGVPHRGSPIADIGKILTHVANAVFKDTNKHIVSSLEVDGEILDRIQTEFMKMLHAQDFSVHSFQEGRGITSVKGFSGKVVNDFSSKLDHPLEVVETIDGNHMQMARFFDAEDPGYRKVSSVIAGHVARLEQKKEAEQSAAMETSPRAPVAKAKRYFRVPHISNKYFVGRTKELEWLHAHLNDPAMQEEQRRVVVWGCGGAGKTQLVSTYAFKYQYEYSAVFWVTATSDLALRKSYSDIARQLGLVTQSNAVHDSSGQQAAIDAVKDWFADHEQGDWLLIIDNVDDLNQVDIGEIIPPTSKGNVIITSRNIQAAGYGSAIELGELEAQDAISLLLRRAGILEPTKNDAAIASDITKSLGYLALAVEHAGAYVQSVGGSLQDYKSQFDTNRKRILEKRPGVSMHKESVFGTFNISFEKILERNLPAARLLCFFGFLDGEAIFEMSLINSPESVEMFKTTVVSEPEKYFAAVQELLSFSLIRIKLDGDVKLISLHPLVHYFSRARMTTDNQWRWKEYTVGWLLQYSTATSADESHFSHLREQLRQIIDLTEYPEDLKRRRRIWCYLGMLLEQYQQAWQNQGGMHELDRYAKMVMEVLEEEPEDKDRLSVLATIHVIDVQVQTVQYIGSGDTYDEVSRRYLVKQMKPSAAKALERARALDDAQKSIGDKFARTSLTPDNENGERGVSPSVTKMVNSISEEMVSGPVLSRDMDVVQKPSNSTENTDSTEPRDIAQNITSINPIAEAASCNDRASLSVSTADGHSSTKQDHHFSPSAITDIFITTTPDLYIQNLIHKLNSLARVYTYQGRRNSSTLLQEYSKLPISLTTHPSAPQSDVANSLLNQISAYTAHRNLPALLQTYRALLSQEPPLHHSQTLFPALDFAIIMLHLREPTESESIIMKRFYATIQTEEERARDLKTAYLWIRKTLARARGMQGRIDEEYQTLIESVKVVEKVSGRGSLSWLHAQMLLTVFNRRKHGEIDTYTTDQAATAAAIDSDAFLLAFEKLYHTPTKQPGDSNEGLQMGMMLLAQGALEEAVIVFTQFTRLAVRIYGEDAPLTVRARRAGLVAKREREIAQREWELESRRGGSGGDVLRFGTICFGRDMEELNALIDKEGSTDENG